MILRLASLPPSLAGPVDPAYKGRVPTRARFAAPAPARSISQIEADGGLVYTDIFRAAEAQRAAKLAKPSSTQPVAYSGHGYGFSIDLDVDAVLFRRKLTYGKLLDYMAARGWHCHRRDRRRGTEDWHFNHLGDLARTLLASADPAKPSTWSLPLEGLIQATYGPQLVLGPDEIVRLLLAANQPTVRSFQAAWGLDADGIAGPRTQRTLAYVTAQLDVVPLGSF